MESFKLVYVCREIIFMIIVIEFSDGIPFDYKMNEIFYARLYRNSDRRT